MRQVMTRIGNKYLGFETAGQAGFHQWGVETVEAETGFGNFTVAVVEYPDGRVDTFIPSNILFLDAPGLDELVIASFIGEAKAA